MTEENFIHFPFPTLDADQEQGQLLARLAVVVVIIFPPASTTLKLLASKLNSLRPVITLSWNAKICFQPSRLIERLARLISNGKKENSTVV